jgi:hypothetical protein
MVSRENPYIPPVETPTYWSYAFTMSGSLINKIVRDTNSGLVGRALGDARVGIGEGHAVWGYRIQLSNGPERIVESVEQATVAETDKFLADEKAQTETK